MRPCLALLLFAVALRPAPAQTSTTYRIAGTIVSAIDHHPLQRAAVQLLNPENQNTVQSTTSDEYGRFAFTGVPAGNTELQGSAPNYLATFYDEHDGFNTGIITGAGVDTESLVLQLLPASVIGGIIRDESAEPVQNAIVHLFRESNNFGDNRYVSAGNASTDDAGRFEIARLKPGTYYAAVTASPWYAVHPPTANDNGDPPPGYRRFSPPRASVAIVDSIDPALDVAYSATFYPGTTDPTAAAPIVLRAGDTRDISLQLNPQPAITVTLPRGAGQNNRPESPPQLHSSFLGLPLGVSSQTIQTQSHTFISGLAPGDYFLSTGAPSFTNGTEGTPIHLADRSTTAELPVSPTPAHVHVTVQPSRDTKLPAHSRVALGGPGVATTFSKDLDAQNQATFDVSPGDYSFGINGGGRSPVVTQVLAGERPLPGNRVHLTADQSAFFTLTVSASTHTFRAVVRKDGKPCPGAFILLLNTADLSDLHNARAVARQQSDLDGSFDLRSLAPGDYTLVAIENGWDIDWHNDSALAHYLPAATPVHIPDTAEKVQTLPRPIPVQPR
ncbi:MAG TPA: carboxypeptidase-like regulatory domain-containing protein [Acidobacteriaceae bacterium]